MGRLPWEYLFEPFDKFQDLYWPMLIASIVLLVVTVIFYNVRTRQLHRHQIYVQMYEWLLWTCVITFSLIIVYWIFKFDFFIVLGTLIAGLGTLVWIRFIRFPPYFQAYERQLAKQRYYSRQRFTHPETTIRTKPAKSTKTKAAKRRRRR